MSTRIWVGVTILLLAYLFVGGIVFLRTDCAHNLPNLIFDALLWPLSLALESHCTG